MRTILSLFFAALMMQASRAQSPCSPKDAGPFLATKPTLNMDIYEATEQELMNQPDQYRAELRLYGQVGGQGANGIELEVMPDYQFMNPEDLFRFQYANGTNYLQMYKAVDRDGPTAAIEDDTSVFSFTLKCSLKSNMSDFRYFDARIFILDRNDNDPMFMNMSSMLHLNELTPNGTVVLMVKVEDKDLNSNLTYSIIPQMQMADDLSSHFKIDDVTGYVRVNGKLDYEAMTSGILVISVMDDGSPARSATATFTVMIEDGDDQGPVYVYPGCWSYRERCSWPKYTASNMLMQGQAIKVLPVPNKIQAEVKIRAKDLDHAANPIVFSIASTIPPGSENMFTVTTMPTGTKGEYEAAIVPKSDMKVNQGFEIFLQAEEQSEQKRFEIAMIFFEDPNYACGGSSSGQTGTNNNGDGSATTMTSEKYTEPIIALIVVVAILAAIILCLAIAFIFVMRKPVQAASTNEVNLRHSANGDARL